MTALSHPALTRRRFLGTSAAALAASALPSAREGRDEAGVVGIEHAVEHGGRHARRLGPIPVGKRELRIAAELADGRLQPSDIGAVPRCFKAQFDAPVTAVWA